MAPEAKLCFLATVQLDQKGKEGDVSEHRLIPQRATNREDVPQTLGLHRSQAYSEGYEGGGRHVLQEATVQEDDEYR